MAMTVRVRLTGEAEKLVREMAKEGIGPRDVIASGLWLASIARRTNRLAVARPNAHLRSDAGEYIEQILIFGEPVRDDDRGSTPTAPPIPASAPASSYPSAGTAAAG